MVNFKQNPSTILNVNLIDKMPDRKVHTILRENFDSQKALSGNLLTCQVYEWTVQVFAQTDLYSAVLFTHKREMKNIDSTTQTLGSLTHTLLQLEKCEWT